MLLHRTILSLLFLSVSAFGVIPAGTVWEVRPTNGNDTNGGGFVAGASGTDFSQQNAKNTVGNNISTTNAVANGSTTITSATASFTAAIVGNIIFLSGGSGSLAAGWFQVVTFTNSTTIVVDSTVAAGTGITLNIGGALQTIVQANTNMQNGNIAWVKAEAVITTASQIGLTVGGGANTFTQTIGYSSTRGDNGQVTIRATAGGFIIVNISGPNGYRFANFILNCNSQTGSTGLNIQTQGNMGINVAVQNCTSNGVTFNNSGNMCVNCVVTGQTTAGSAFIMGQGNGANTCMYCVATGGSTPGFTSTDNYFCIRCIAANNTGALSDGFRVPNNGSPINTSVILNSVAYKNGGDGFQLTVGAPAIVLHNNISYGNIGFGFNDPTGLVSNFGIVLNFSAYGANTAGNLSNLPVGSGDVVLGSDPFVNGVGNNFALTPAAITAIGGAGFPGILLTGGTGHLGIGALQPSGGGGGGGGQVGSAIIQ